MSLGICEFGNTSNNYLKRQGRNCYHATSTQFLRGNLLIVFIQSSETKATQKIENYIVPLENRKRWEEKTLLHFSLKYMVKATDLSFHFRYRSESAVPDEVFVAISAELGERDWVQVATALGLGEKDCRRIRRKYPGRAREQAHQMLLLWKQQRGEAANLNSLHLALRNSGFENIALGLNCEWDSV